LFFLLTAVCSRALVVGQSGGYVGNIWPVLLIAGLGGVARNMRVMRGNLLDVLGAQYVTTARSKGLKESKVMVKHAMPNALHPIVAYQGTVLPYMMQGELEAAIVLGLPTMGPLFYLPWYQPGYLYCRRFLIDVWGAHCARQPAG
jgi:ABC-type dipeptide/oligopeptide/nickel transport system permease component